MDEPTTQKSPEMLEHTFRIEDNAIGLLIKEIQNSEVSAEHAAHVAQKILEIVGQAFSRKEMAGLIDHASQEYPELKELSVQEHLYVKNQAEKLIKQTIESLLVQKNIDDALKLAQTINHGEIPEELRLKIEAI